MFIQMKGLKGQGDIWIQREIIRNMSTDDNTKLCVVVEPYGGYGMQDDTAIDFSLDFKRIDMNDKFWGMWQEREKTRAAEKEILNSIAEEVFKMNGLVVLGPCFPHNYVMQRKMMEIFEAYYYERVEASTFRKTHLVFVMMSEG